MLGMILKAVLKTSELLLQLRGRLTPVATWRCKSENKWKKIPPTGTEPIGGGIKMVNEGGAVI